MIELELPYPPSVNHYWRHTRGGTRVSKEVKTFRANVEAVVFPMQLGTLMGELEMAILVYPPDERRRDVDNCLKAVLDALEHCRVYEDDNQVKLLTIEQLGVVKRGRCMVRIWNHRKQTLPVQIDLNCEKCGAVFR